MRRTASPRAAISAATAMAVVVFPQPPLLLAAVSINARFFMLSSVLMFAEIPDTLMLIIPAVFFLPLLLILLKLNEKRPAQTVSLTAPADPLQGLAIFSKKYDLTQRESEILSLMAEGLTDDEIADKCCISRNTVRFHVSNILKKTGAAGRTEAARMLRIEGVL